MIKRYITSGIIILTVFLILGSYLVYNLMSREIPFFAPTTTIKYNDKVIPTSLGDHNWTPKGGGSSYETGGEFNVGQKTSEFIAKAGSKVNISIPSKPKNIRMNQLLDNNYKHKEYKIIISGKKYEFILPTQKGLYIFEVYANWDDNYHNTATIFRVEIK